MSNLNRVVKALIFADFFLFFSWGLIVPIFAIFVVDHIDAENAASIAGISIGLYWVVKSVLQVPIAKWLDFNKGEKDDYWLLVVGLIITSFSPLFFLVATEASHLYIIQAIHGIGMALTAPSWGGIFLRHKEPGVEAEEYSLDNSALGLGVGLSAILGGVVAEVIGFSALFIGVSIIGMISVFIILYVGKDIVPGINSKLPFKRTKNHIR